MKISTTISVWALLVSAGLACAQGVYVSGYLHTPTGAATLGPVTERRLPVNNLGSSGQDGVELQLHTVRGGSVSLDMSGMYPPSSTGVSGEIKIKHKGWDGLIYGTHRVTGSFSQGHVQEEFDFSALGSSGVYAVCYTVNGVEWVQQTTSSILRCTTEVRYSESEKCEWTCGAGKATFSDLSFSMHRSTGRAATITFDSSDPGVPPVVVTDVVAIACRPICIVAPCPGDWTNLQSMIITGSGMSEFACSNAVVTRRMLLPTLPSPPPLAPPHGITSGTGNGQVAESCCADLDGDGVEDLVDIVSNIGSSGQDGVEVKWPRGVGSCSRKWGNGHVTLIKFTDDEGSEARMTCVKDTSPSCSSTFTADCSSLGWAQTVLICRDQQGNELSSRLLSSGESFSVDTCGSPLTSTIEMVAAAAGQPATMKVSFQDFHFCTFSNGTPPQPGVYSVHLRESPTQGSTGQTKPPKMSRIMSATITSQGGDIFAGEMTTTPIVPTCVADVDDGSGSGTPDGGTGIEDLLYYLLRYDAGC